MIVYGSGANNHIAEPFNLFQGEVMELVRVALNGKQKTTSQALAMTLSELKRAYPHIKIIVSYADLDQKHAGTIYQATNWIYLGKYNENNANGSTIVLGKKVHNRTLNSKYGTCKIEWLRRNVDKHAKPFVTKGKHKYIFCFDKKLRKKWLKEAKPYPKKEAQHGEDVT